MTDQPRSEHRSAQPLRIYTTIAMTVVMALAGWSAKQFIEVRDGVRELQQTMPLKMDLIDLRVQRLEDAQKAHYERLDSDPQQQ